MATGRTKLAVAIGDQAQDAEPKALTVREAGRVLRLESRSVLHLFHTGAIEGNQLGHAIRLNADSVYNWLRGKPAASDTEA